MLLKQMQSFLPFELFIVGLFLLLCWHAVRMKAYHRAEYLTAFLYALMFEELDIRLFKTYHYGDGYFLMLGQVPIVIALAWAVIIYTSMQISDCFDLSNLAKASLDALLAVLIDLSVDAIAIRRGYWQWSIPLHAGWFGVPAGTQTLCKRPQMACPRPLCAATRLHRSACQYRGDRHDQCRFAAR
jgi:uncharacterized membrane protein